uniref:Uncharacterized protein n=1 Tax=viral metagenome TaxID=1070528 RepID=A0A6H1ZPS6_9ZZZZ
MPKVTKKVVKAVERKMPEYASIIYGGKNGQPKGFFVYEKLEDEKKYNVYLHGTQNTPKGTIYSYVYKD